MRKRWFLGTGCILLLGNCMRGAPSVLPHAMLRPGADGANQTTKGEFNVVHFGPTGTVVDRKTPALTMLFNRSMRSLDEEVERAAPPIRVETEDGKVVDGKWRFVGTRGILFAPERELRGATRYMVTVPKGIASLGGEALPHARTFEFSTEPPRVLRSPKEIDGPYLRPTEPLRFAFNQWMQASAIEKSAKIILQSDRGEAPKVIPFRASVTTKITNEAPYGTVELKPLQPLPLDREVEVAFDRTLSGEGALLPTTVQKYALRTFGAQRLANYTCPRVQDAKLGRCQAHRDVSVVLANAVLPSEFEKYVRLGAIPRAPKKALPVDPPNAAKEGAPVHHKAKIVARTQFTLGIDPEFGKRYRVRIGAGMTDVYGQRLEKDLTFDIDTEMPFSIPKVATGNTAAPGENESPPAASPSAQPPVDESAPHRAVAPYEAVMGLRGTLFEAKTNAGVRSHNVPVGVVNVPTFGLYTRALREREVLKQLVSRYDNKPAFQWWSPSPKEDTRYVQTIELDKVLAANHGLGVARIALGLPGAGTESDQMVSVSDLGVTAKMTGEGTTVWVTELSTGKPVQGAEVSLVSKRKPEKAFPFATDTMGLAMIPRDAANAVRAHATYGGYRSASLNDDLVLFVRKGDDFTFRTLENSPNANRASGGVQLGGGREWQGTLFTDRGIYRPGEHVKVSGIVRRAIGSATKIPEGEDVRFVVQDESDETVFDTRGVVDAFGHMAFDFQIPKGKRLGVLHLVLSAAGGEVARSSVELASYKASEFKVKVEGDKSGYVRGDEANITASAEYLFGAPMANADATLRSVREIASFTPPGAEGFVTADEYATYPENAASLRTSDLGHKEDELSEQGTLGEKLSLVMPGQLGPERVVVEAEVEDFTHQTVASSASFFVHPAEHYVGLKRSPRFLAAGASVKPDVIALTPKGERVQNTNVTVDLIKRTWISAIQKNASGGGTNVTRIKDDVVATCTVRTGTPSSCDLRVPEAGYFIVRGISKDKRGNEVRASYSFYGVSDRTDENVSVEPRSNDARVVKLELDKNEYNTGDSAKILIRNPYRTAQALITVEREGVMWKTVREISGPMPVVDVPISENFFPNAYVSVHLVRGRVAAPSPFGSLDVGAPDYRMGYAELRVNANARRLKLEVLPTKKEVRPGEEIDVDVVVRDALGKPTQAELTFYAVDEGVLMLSGYQTPDPLPAFTQRRPLGVATMDNRDDLARILFLKPGEKLKSRGVEYARVASEDSETAGGEADKGDDGGGGGENLGKRSDFRATAFFEAGRVSDKEGRTRFHFKLPDNLTTFRLMAVASSKNDRFGSGDAPVTANKQLMIRPALPRALRVGDQFQAKMVISTKGYAAAKQPGGAKAVVELSVKGAKLVSPKTQAVQISERGNVTALFSLVATDAGRIDLDAKVHAGAERDAVTLSREVEWPLSKESLAAYGETTTSAAVGLGDLTHARPETGTAHISYSSSALVGLGSAFRALEEYPYGCSEQIVSRGLPFVSLGDLAKETGVRLPDDREKKLDEAVSSLLQHLSSSGGFGYWDDDEEVPWLTGYALLFLDSAKKQGAFVPRSELGRIVSRANSMLDTSLRRLTSTKKPVRDPNEDDEGETADVPQRGKSPEEFLFEAAFLADVLATIGSPNTAELNKLFDLRGKGTSAVQSLLLHAFSVAKMPRSQQEVLAKEVEASLSVRAEDAYAPGMGFGSLLDSEARSTAFALRSLTSFDKKHRLLPKLARGLLGLRRTGSWQSTQETAWALLALADYRKTVESGPVDMTAYVFAGNEKLAEGGFVGAAIKAENVDVPFAKLLSLGGPISFDLKQRTKDPSKLFYAVELSYSSSSLPKKPVDHGIFVSRTFRSVKPEDLEKALRGFVSKSDPNFSVGSLVLVDVLLESAETVRQVVVDDPLPAGFEPIDMRLQTASSLARDALSRTGGSDLLKEHERALGTSFREVSNHREMHDNHVLTFVDTLEPGLYRFQYLARATSEGQFVAPPAFAGTMYSPEQFGRTAAMTVTVR